MDLYPPATTIHGSSAIGTRHRPISVPATPTLGLLLHHGPARTTPPSTPPLIIHPNSSSSPALWRKHCAAALQI